MRLHFSFQRLLRSACLTALVACGGTAPPSSLAGGRLLPCPPRPNCVSTDDAEAPGRRMAAVPFTDAPAEAHRRAVAALAAEPRAVIITDEPTYVRAAVSSRVFHFVDDVELRLDTTAHVILFRSASRLGHSDLGVNRARMQRIIARLRM